MVTIYSLTDLLENLIELIKTIHLDLSFYQVHHLILTQVTYKQYITFL